nr:hypothetical protein [Actinomycetota bacterium]NIS36166.1 hypothetical protein [Actinomycetota bacterium]NIU22194.1 hypothetical protein [Actinomycetota bacterium]NIU70738.1 hypothetical protein [Actinomycetota bacterium]NIV58735.1 hypothetical protein [Actinomycetota bacterium]
RPPFLGLVRSNDSGESWEIVDLLGDADFHALAPTPTGLFAAETTGRIWFLDETSGQWSQLGEIEARDLAVNPADPTQQLAPDYDAGVWASNDGAVTWTRLDTAPPLIEIEWDSAQGIVGITVDGGVWVSDELEGPWTETAAFDSADEVETFYIDPNGNWWVTVHGGAIFHSTDAGGTWDQAYDPPDRP